ncbi:complement C2 [Pelobates cultripes]|uniref:Complement C2 n=4 Tax=Pelobates cultripes TaxID=61616 RepID=A0AAD1SXR4_PELCU|nr:complement C2 [Pelobates cultripes]
MRKTSTHRTRNTALLSRLPLDDKGQKMGELSVSRDGCLLLGIILLAGIAERASSVDCPPNTGFTGDLTSLSNGLKEGSKAQFLCPTGKYPWPVSSRVCLPSGQWSLIKSNTGRKYNTVSCKDMRCPEPLSFENGEYYPRGPFLVGANITFQCNDGYHLRGSMERMCRRNAKWSGETAVCVDGDGHCPDPGVPPGAVKTGTRYEVDERVSYECSRGLTLVGSKQRTCLENTAWSGTEVSCQYPYAFDLPEDVSEHFMGTISGVLKTQQQGGAGRTIKIKKNGILNVYIVLDASRSVGEDNFAIYKDCAKQIVDGLGRFDMTVEFGVISYATEVNVVVRIHDEDADYSDTVSDTIENNLQYADHADKSGTNTKAALQEVYNMMSFQKDRYKTKDWESIQHVIILMTDGKANMGGHPKDVVRKIRDFLNITPEREDFLDVYAFGIGVNDVDQVELNDVASRKDNERHMFILENAEDMKTVFAKILDLKTVGDMCGINEEHGETSRENWNYLHPWTAIIQTQALEPCLGSLISKSWVLTAAHCFKAIPTQVEIGPLKFAVKDYKTHKCYNQSRKASIGLKEDYDYDLGLIQLDSAVTFSQNVRTICTPCTEPANRAMKKTAASTCKEHSDWLMTSNEIPAQYLAKDEKTPKDRQKMNRKDVQIKINQARDACVSAVQNWDPFKDIDPSLLVSPRHLCVEGDMSCKGESGGPLYLERKKRFFQVGILSFGIYNPCTDKSKQRKNPEARDFYVNVLEILPWLRKHVDDLEFLADVDVEDNIVCPS